MSVDTHVSSRSTQTLSFSIWNVLFRLGITILLRHTEIDNVDNCMQNMIIPTPTYSKVLTIRAFRARATNEKVVRFYVPIDEVLFVNRLYTRKLVHSASE